MILGYHGPTVREQADMALAGVYHRFHRKSHSGLQLHAVTRFAVVQHLRIFVIDAADAVTAVLAHHREIFGLDQLLDGITNIAQVGAGLDLFDSPPHGLEADVHQPLRLHIGLAHEVHAAGIAVETLFNDR